MCGLALLVFQKTVEGEIEFKNRKVLKVFGDTLDGEHPFLKRLSSDGLRPACHLVEIAFPKVNLTKLA